MASAHAPRRRRHKAGSGGGGGGGSSNLAERRVSWRKFPKAGGGADDVGGGGGGGWGISAGGAKPGRPERVGLMGLGQGAGRAQVRCVRSFFTRGRRARAGTRQGRGRGREGLEEAAGARVSGVSALGSVPRLRNG